MEGGHSMKKVLLVAPLMTQSGYGVHSRQVAKWLLSKNNIDLKIIPVPWGETPWLLNRDSCDGLIGKIMEKTVPNNSVSDADVSFQIQLPNEWNPNLAKKNIGITAGMETDVCNPSWINSCNKMDCVVVPSNHAKETFNRTGKIEKTVHVIPESYPDCLNSNEQSENINLNLPAENNFLIVSQLTGNNPFTDRKNVFFTIKWLCETFAGRQDVGIVLKTNMGRNSSIDRKAVTNTLQQLLKEVRKEAYPKLHLIHGTMSDEEMKSLYKNPKIKALISLTRGEGYGLPLLEAAVTGLPIIATGWSGHMDFLGKGRFISIDYKLENIHASRVDNNIFMQGSKWAAPSEEDFKKKVKKFLESPTVPQQWASELSSRLTQEYSHDSVCRQYDSCFGELF